MSLELPVQVSQTALRRSCLTDLDAILYVNDIDTTLGMCTGLQLCLQVGMSPLLLVANFCMSCDDTD
jgi:hypothetical protein